MADTTLSIRQAELQALEVDTARAMIRDRPMADVYWVSLLKPRNLILRRFREALDQMTPQARDAVLGPSGGLLGADGQALIGPLGQLMRPTDEEGPIALISVADAVTAKAILGDLAAAEAIANRIEGRPGTRKNDEDAETTNRRGEMILAIEETVRLMQAQPGDSAKVVDEVVVETKKPNGKGVTDVEIENTIKDIYGDKGEEKKPNGKPPPKKPPSNGNGFTS